MRLLAQVRHVMGKDLREARWALGAYVAFVLAVTARVAGWLSETGLSGALWMLLVVPLGLFAAAIVLQTDPPLRSDAFWASRPLSPGAVLVAKLLMAVAIVVVGAAGQFAALMAYDLPAGDAIAKAGQSGMVFGVLVLAALVLAAVTGELRTFALALLAIPVLGVLASSLAFELPPAPAGVVNVARTVGGVAAGLLLLAWVYRARDVRMILRIAASATVLAMLFGPPARPSGAPPSASVTPAGALPYGSVALLSLDPVEIGRQGVHLRAIANLRSEAYELQLMDRRVTFYLRDTSFVAPPSQEASTRLVWSSLPIMPDVHWLQSRGARRGPAGITVELPASQRMLLARGVDSVTIEGDLVASEATVAAAIPLVKHAPITRRGRRFYIEDLAHDGRHAALDLRTTSVLDPDSDEDVPFAANFGLVNRTRGEAIVLNRGNSQGSSGGLVLPGAGLRVNRMALSTEDNFNRPDPPSVDSGWMAEAELIAIERVTRGRHRVRLTSVVKAGLR